MSILNQYMTEAELQQAIIEAADRLGYEWHHETDSRKSRPGFPDLHIVGHGRQIVIELKTASGKVSPEQWRWIERYKEAGVDAWVIRPNSLDFILSELERSAA